jgi:hypothetical protein
MSPATTSKSITSCRSFADGFRLGNRLVSDSPSISSPENSVVALALLLPDKRSSASFPEDSAARKRARICSYLQEALDLCDTSLALLDDDDDNDASETHTHSGV